MTHRLAMTGALALLAVAAAPPAGATYDGNHGRIAYGAFVAADRTQADIWSVQPGGQASRQLTDAPGRDICPAYSADGRWIAFCSDRTGSFEIWVMKANGKQERQITTLGSHATFPDFSSDGSQLAFSAEPVGGGNTDLWQVPVAGGEPTSSPTPLTRWRSIRSGHPMAPRCCSSASPGTSPAASCG